MLPREHGAYVQLGLALVSGLLLGHGTHQAWSQAGLTGLLFLASGPALVLVRSGSPGPGAESQSGAAALLAGLGVPALLLAGWAWGSAGPAQWQAAAVPGALAVALFVLGLLKRDHTAPGELLAALAFASAAYPVAILGEASPQDAKRLALALAAVQSIGTLTVRAFLASMRSPRQRWPRILPVALAILLLGLAAASGWSSQGLALVPNIGIAAWLLWTPLQPRSLKHIGWALAMASAAGLLPLALALRWAG